MASFYFYFRLFIRLVLKLYFRKIKVEGRENVPSETPLIVVANHQNALLDPLLVGSFIPRSLHYLARSDVFTKKTIPFLKLLQMIPIYRIRDGYSKLSLNDLVFDQCKSIFRAGGAVLIFAEGNHGREHFLRPLTKGAARLAMQSQMGGATDIMVQPVGLNFWEHKKPRSTVLLKFGEPFPVKSFVADFESNEAKGLIELRNAMSVAMKKTLVLPESDEHYESRKISTFQPSTELLSFEELRKFRGSYEPGRISKNHFFARLLNPFPFLVITHFLKRTSDVVFHGTVKFSSALILFPLWWTIIFSVLAFLFGWKLASLAVFVAIASLFYDYRNG